jgi:hypothetical protein
MLAAGGAKDGRILWVERRIFNSSFARVCVRLGVATLGHTTLLVSLLIALELSRIVTTDRVSLIL